MFRTHSKEYIQGISNLIEENVGLKENPSFILDYFLYRILPKLTKDQALELTSHLKNHRLFDFIKHRSFPLRPGDRVMFVGRSGCYIRKGFLGTVVKQVPSEEFHPHDQHEPHEEVWKILFDPLPFEDEDPDEPFGPCDIRREELDLLPLPVKETIPKTPNVQRLIDVRKAVLQEFVQEFWVSPNSTRHGHALFTLVTRYPCGHRRDVDEGWSSCDRCISDYHLQKIDEFLAKSEKTPDD